MATDAAHIVIVDNYDSFTYNTVHVLGGLGARCSVLLNDRTTPAEIEALAPDGVLLSAGPGTPLDAANQMEAHIRLFWDDVLRQIHETSTIPLVPLPNRKKA